MLAWNCNSRLAQRFDDIASPMRMFTLKRRRDQRRRACLLGVTGLMVLDCLLSVLFVHLTLRFPGNASERSSLLMPRSDRIRLGFHRFRLEQSRSVCNRQGAWGHSFARFS